MAEVRSTTVPSIQPEIRPASRFVKVFMQGYVIGRKINLGAHDGYESLSLALTNLASNFLSMTCSNINLSSGSASDDNNFALFYEDYEGHRMLIGQVPWELFITSAKRLYIVPNPRENMQENDDGGVSDD